MKNYKIQKVNNINIKYEYNRYVEAYFNGKFFELSSFKGPTLNQEIERISINFFKKHPEFIDKGVLNNTEIFKIKESFKTFC